MTWDNITIRQWQDIQKELREDYEDDIERSIGILATINNKTISYYKNELTIKELKEELSKLAFLCERPKSVKLHSIIDIGEKRMKFNLNMRTISAGQYIDLTELVKDEKKIDDNLHIILAVLCEEIDKKGKKIETDTKERAKYLHENMPMTYVISLRDFFLSNYQRLIKAISDYLESKMRKMKMERDKATSQALSNIGVGITP